jgi:ribosomal protein S27E
VGDTTVVRAEPHEDACPGPCNAAYRRAWQAYGEAFDRFEQLLAAWTALAGWLSQPRPPILFLPAVVRIPAPVQPTPPTQVSCGDPVWCRRCVAVIRQALVELDDLARQVEADADGHRRQPAAGGGGAAGRSVRSPSPAADLVDSLYGFLTGIEDEWRTARGYAPRPQRRHRGAHARSICIAWLLGELADILAHGTDPERMGRRVLAWVTVLRDAAKARPEPKRLPVRCPRCDRARTLSRRDDGYVRCGACGRHLSPDEYDELAVAQAVKEAP